MTLEILEIAIMISIIINVILVIAVINSYKELEEERKKNIALLNKMDNILTRKEIEIDKLLKEEITIDNNN